MKKITLIVFTLLSMSWTSEENLINLLSQKLTDFNKTNPCYQLHLVLNQNKLVPGDTLFFSAYLFNEDFQPIRGRRVLPLELLNHEGGREQIINFEVNDGKGSNQIVVPGALVPGLYQLAVRSILDQTNYMELFSKEIIIVDKTRIGKAVKKPANSISIFPEGGNLIGDVENTLIVKSEFRGPHQIKNEKNETIADFSVDEIGYSKVSFTPEKDHDYYVETNGQNGKVNIEKARDEGCALQLKVPDDGPITVKLSTSTKVKKQDLFAVVVSRRKIIFSGVVNFNETNSSQISIPREPVPDGLNQLTIFDKAGNILADRIFFLNRKNVSASITIQKSSLKQRERVDVEALLQDSYGNPITGNFTVSVVQKNFFTEQEGLSFRNELLLSSIPNITSDMLEVSSTPERFLVVADMVLAASTLKMIPWKELIVGNTIPKTVIKSALSLKGKAVFKNSGTPVPDSTLLAGFLQKNMIGYETYTKKDGKFELKFLLNFWGDDELFFLMDRRKSLGEDYTIIPDNSVAPRPLHHEVSFLTDSIDIYADYRSKKKIVSQSYNFFSGNQNKIGTFKDLNAQFEDEAEGADFTVNVQDYVVFPTMEDLIREVIPFLEYRKKNSTIRLMLPHKSGNIHPKSEPLFVIDGVLTKNKNIFMSLKPNDILFIKLINNPNKLSKWGLLGKNGIVLVTTKSVNSLMDEERASLIKVSGLSKPIEFVSPEYSKSNNTRVPDLRSTLLWIPSIKCNSSGKANFSFFTSDDTGVFQVKIKGITSRGEPFEAITSFEVMFN